MTTDRAGASPVDQPVRPVAEARWHWYSDDEGHWEIECADGRRVSPAEGARVPLYDQATLDAAVANARAAIYSAEQAQIEAPWVAERDRLRAEWSRECDGSDALLRALALDPQAMRTDGGSLNLPKIRAALAGRVSF